MSLDDRISNFGRIGYCLWVGAGVPIHLAQTYGVSLSSWAELATDLQTVRGKVEVDVFATDSSVAPSATYLCECKRWTSRVPKAEVKSFRTDVADFGANYGLFISSCGFQSGAHDVVENTNVRLLDWQGFQDLFMERWCSRYWVPTMRKRGDRLAAYVDPPVSDAAGRLHRGEVIQPVEAAGLFMLDLWGCRRSPWRTRFGVNSTSTEGASRSPCWQRAPCASCWIRSPGTRRSGSTGDRPTARGATHFPTTAMREACASRATRTPGCDAAV
jgi:hypothetical protein